MKNNLCPVCGGVKAAGSVTFTVDDGTSLVVVRQTPAMVCSQCGEEWISDSVATNLENIVHDAKSKHRTIEVVNFEMEDAA
jgi:YgiT-type zinc finger domain-containing protein